MGGTSSRSGGASMLCCVSNEMKRAKSRRSQKPQTTVLRGVAGPVTEVWQRRVLWFAMVLVWAVFVHAAPSFASEKGSPSDQAVETAPADIGFFAAMERGMIDVRVVAQSYSSLAIRVRNVTRKPLEVELPATFAAVPARRVQARQVLRRQGTPASLSDNYVQQQGNSQGLGGSLSGPWWNRTDSRKNHRPNVNKGPEQNPETLTLAPTRFAQARIPCFCLEYGKPDPNSRIPYVIRPLEELNQHAGVAKLLAEFGRQPMNQYAAQLAAWHMANDVPWRALAKFRFPPTDESPGHRVTQAELLAAKTLVTASKQRTLSGSR